MQFKEVTVRFRFFRSFYVSVFLINAAALIFFKPFISFAAAFLAIAWIAWCIRCPTCDKSPFLKLVGSSPIGIPIPERKCSKCGRDFVTDTAAKVDQ